MCCPELWPCPFPTLSLCKGPEQEALPYPVMSNTKKKEQKTLYKDIAYVKNEKMQWTEGGRERMSDKKHHRAGERSGHVPLSDKSTKKGKETEEVFLH